MSVPQLVWLEDLAEKRIITQTADPGFYGSTDIIWNILRTDLIHPICSGNKFFKLKYYLLEALQKNHTIIATSGGAWSNHIVATAFAAKACGLRSVGLIRGEESPTPSSTIREAAELGMEIRFMGRKETRPESLVPEAYYIPAGGYGPLGARGAGEMLTYAGNLPYTHILCASGTGTMLAGLAQAAPDASVIGIAVLKHGHLGKEAASLIGKPDLEILHDYHFGGYAKKTPELIGFMNGFFTATGIPTDFVYTGKLMYGIRQLIQKQFFPPQSRILAIHSGGLQGNKSLKKGELIY